MNEKVHAMKSLPQPALPQPVPKCIAFIMDGNRRFSKLIAQKPAHLGHSYGVKMVRRVLKWCREAGIRHIILYALSTENLKSRPRSELNFLMKLFEKEFRKILGDKRHDAHINQIRIHIIGRLDLLPKHICTLARAVERATRHYDAWHVYLALAYGGRLEITDACQKIAKKVYRGLIAPKAINESVVATHLYDHVPEPDLVIRTGGEKRISNFLLWQIAYSELVFLDTPWPQLKREEFYNCLREYALRQRRFGA